MSKQTEKQFGRMVRATQATQEDIDYFVNREYDRPIPDYDDEYYNYDGYSDCGCCECCGHSDACCERRYKSYRKQWPLRLKVRVFFSDIFLRFKGE